MGDADPLQMTAGAELSIRAVSLHGASVTGSGFTERKYLFP